MKKKLLLLLLLLCISCRSIIIKLVFANSLLIDTGYRVEETIIIGDPIVLSGNEMNKVVDMFKKKQFINDKSYFNYIHNYFRDRLPVWNKKFHNKNNREIAKEYPNFNTENMLIYGFYFGCTDLCALVGSVLVNTGYKCKFVYTVSEQYSDYLGKNYGHTYLYIEKDNKSYLFDPGMSRQIFEGYKIGTNKLKVKSIMVGDQLIYAIHDFPGKIIMQDFYYEESLRKKAKQYWESLNK
jgi:hypothetical protein